MKLETLALRDAIVAVLEQLPVASTREVEDALGSHVSTMPHHPTGAHYSSWTLLACDGIRCTYAIPQHRPGQEVWRSLTAMTKAGRLFRIDPAAGCKTILWGLIDRPDPNVTSDLEAMWRLPAAAR